MQGGPEAAFNLGNDGTVLQNLSIGNSSFGINVYGVDIQLTNLTISDIEFVGIWTSSTSVVARLQMRDIQITNASEGLWLDGHGFNLERVYVSQNRDASSLNQYGSGHQITYSSFSDSD